MNYLINPNLTRRVIDGFAFPLGWQPRQQKRPMEGYTIELLSEEGDLPETHQFQIIVSHEKLQGILTRLFALLPAQIFPIIEVGSRDAYRQMDTYMSRSPIDQREFESTWKDFEAVLLDDCCIAAGAMSEDPYVEVFLTEVKGVAVNVETARSAEVESILDELGLNEVPRHWADDELDDNLASVLIEDDEHMGLDDVILAVQRAWQLELHVDPEVNVDENGRDLGTTLWHVLVLAVKRDQNPAPGAMAYIDIWLSADSLAQVDNYVDQVFDDLKEWDLDTVVSQDRVAFDDRPESLNDMKQNATQPGVWSVEVQPFE